MGNSQSQPESQVQAILKDVLQIPLLPGSEPAPPEPKSPESAPPESKVEEGPAEEIAMKTSPAEFSPGVYILLNCSSGTALDLSGGDSRSIIGFDCHGFENQQWMFEKIGAGYLIQSVQHKTFLAFEGDLACGSKIVANTFPTCWKVELEEEGQIRILWPDGRYAIELDGGSDVPGTLVRFGDNQCHEQSQMWRLQKREVEDSSRAAVSESVKTEETRVEIPGSDTVVVSHDGNTTTTTRITTTVTTVTTVCKSSCSHLSEQDHQTEHH